jgi:hypothetical protein
LADPVLSEQLNHTLAETHLDALGERYRGKVGTSTGSVTGSSSSPPIASAPSTAC